MLKYQDAVGGDLLDLASSFDFSIEFYEHEIRIEDTQGNQGLSVMEHKDGSLRYIVDSPPMEEYTERQMTILSVLTDMAKLIESDIKAAQAATTEEPTE